MATKFYFNKEQEEFILNNFEKLRAPECSRILGISNFLVTGLAKKLGFKTRKPLKFNPIHFLDIKTPEVAYILGLMWADGHISKKSCDISFTNVTDDAKELEKMVLKTGDWSIYKKKQGDHRQSTTYYCYNPVLHKFLTDMDYTYKVYPKILKLIPEHLHHYWYRGVFDGDGHIAFNEKRKNYFIFIASTFDDNWNYMIELCDKLRLPYKITRKVFLDKTTKQIHRGSIFSITKRRHTDQFCDFIFKDRAIDNIGFTRKFNKFLESKKMPPTNINATGYMGMGKSRSNYYFFYFRVNKESYLSNYFSSALNCATERDKIMVKIWGKEAELNFPIENYLNELEFYEKNILPISQNIGSRKHINPNEVMEIIKSNSIYIRKIDKNKRFNGYWNRLNIS